MKNVWNEQQWRDAGSTLLKLCQSQRWTVLCSMNMRRSRQLNCCNSTLYPIFIGDFLHFFTPARSPLDAELHPFRVHRCILGVLIVKYETSVVANYLRSQNLISARFICTCYLNVLHQTIRRQVAHWALMWWISPTFQGPLPSGMCGECTSHEKWIAWAIKNTTPWQLSNCKTPKKICFSGTLSLVQERFEKVWLPWWRCCWQVRSADASPLPYCH